MTPCTHLHLDFRHVAGLSDKERIQFMDQPRWIEYSKARTILKTLERRIDMPKRPRMLNLLIVGEPNNGKTTLVRTFFESHGASYVNDEAEPVKPIILAEAPPSADEKGLYISILERFVAPYKPNAATSALRYQAIHMLRFCHTRMLVIDEFHSLLTGTATKQRELMNAVKLLCNELAIPIVGVGTREAVQVLHTDPQHASRFDVVELPKWDLSREFQRLLASFEAVLPLKEASNLQHPELATLIHAICGGNIGNLHRLLVECATDAIESGKEHIDKEIVESNAWVRPTHGIRERRA